MGDSFSMCCCDGFVYWGDLLIGGGISPPTAVVGLHETDTTVTALGYPDPLDSSQLIVGRFGTTGDFASTGLTSADGANSADDGHLVFDLQAQCLLLTGHSLAAVTDDIFGLPDGRVAYLDGMLDLGAGGVFATISAEEDLGSFGLTDRTLVRAIWFNTEGNVAASYLFPTAADESAFTGNFNDSTAPFRWRVTSSLYEGPWVDGGTVPSRSVAWNEDTIAIYDASISTDGVAVGVLTSTGPELEVVTLENTWLETLPGPLTIPGVDVVGYYRDPGLPAPETITAINWSCDGISSGNPATEDGTITIGYWPTIIFSASANTDPADYNDHADIVWYPNFTRIVLPSPWEPKGYVERQTHSITTGSAPEFNRYVGGGFLSYGAARVYKYVEGGLGIRTGPSVLATMEHVLFGETVSVFQSGEYADTVETGDAETLDVSGATAQVGLHFYYSTDAVDVVIYGEGFVTVTAEEYDTQPPTTTPPTCPLGVTDTDDDGRTSYTVTAVGLWRRTIDTDWRGQFLRSIATNGDHKTPWLTLGHVALWPFYNNDGDAGEVPALHTVSGRVVYDETADAFPGDGVFFTPMALNLYPTRITPFWGATGAGDAAFVMLCPWSDGADINGADLVFMSLSHAILGVWRFDDSVPEVIRATSQAVYLRVGPTGGFMITRDGKRGAVTQAGTSSGPGVLSDNWDLPPNEGLVSEVDNIFGRLIRHADIGRLTYRPRNQFPVRPL